MLAPGRIPLNDQEHVAVEALLVEHGEQVSLTRRDPGETGPVVVTADDKVFHVHDDGSVEAA